MSDDQSDGPEREYEELAASLNEVELERWNYDVWFPRIEFYEEGQEQHWPRSCS